MNFSDTGVADIDFSPPTDGKDCAPAQIASLVPRVAKGQKRPAVFHQTLVLERIWHGEAVGAWVRVGNLGYVHRIGSRGRWQNV